MFARSLFVSALFVIAACGSVDDKATPDARPADGAAASITEVTCPATPAATVTTVNGTDAYAPAATTITQGQVVRFTMSTEHDVSPQSGTPTTLRVGLGQQKCFTFAATGTFRFGCTPHGFAGTVTVN